MSLALPQLASLPAHLDSSHACWLRCVALARTCDTGWTKDQGLAVRAQAQDARHGLLLRISASHGSLLLQVDASAVALLACAAIHHREQRDACAALLVWSLLGWLLAACEESPDSVHCTLEHAALGEHSQLVLLSQGLCFVMLQASPAWPQALERYLRARPVPCGWVGRQLRLSCRLVCAQVSLPASDLRSLRTGDVLLSSRTGTSLAHALSQAPLRLLWGDTTLAHLSAEVTYQDGTMTLHQRPEPSTPLVPEDVPPAEPREWPLRWEQLELSVQFALDAAPMTLSELAALGPGHVLQLPQPAQAARVRLLVQGQTLGFGELVVIGECLGVRLHEHLGLAAPAGQEHSP
jgi:type III secretion system YscQ/HrcQ family protein